MRTKELTITGIAGVVAAAAGIALGMIVHKRNTPDLRSVTMRGEIVMKDNAHAWDEYVFGSGHGVQLTRTFSGKSISAPVQISADGSVKEKPRNFQLKFSNAGTRYLSNEKAINEKGKEIPARKLIDKTIKIPKKSVSQNEATFLLKQKNLEGRKEMIGFKMSVDRSGSPESLMSAAEKSSPWDFKLYKSPQGGYCVRYPSSMRLSSADGTSATISSQDGITVWIARVVPAEDVPDLEALYKNYLTEYSASSEVLYKTLKDKFFVLSGREQEHGIYYLRVCLDDSQFYEIKASYPESQKAEMEPWINSFSSFPNMNVVRYAGTLEGGATTYKIAVKLTLREDGGASGYYWYTKYKESNNVNLGGKVSDTQPHILELDSEKKTERWTLNSEGSNNETFSMGQTLTGTWLKYESEEARNAGAEPINTLTIALRRQ